MNRIALMSAVLTGALLVPSPSFAQVSCTRDGLQRAVDLYIDAQTTGDTSAMPLAIGLGYIENMAPADISKGLIKTPMKIDHQRSLLDMATCQTFTEVIVTNKEKPYVLGTRLRVNHDKIAEIETLWTTTGYWLFNADAYLRYSSTEKWDVIPVDKRDTRTALVAAANAYLDAFLEGKMDLVPWGLPCNRTEGGAHTGRGAADDSCQVGVPSGVNIANRRFVVDETIGAVVVFCTFGAGNAAGGSGAPDTHLFRVENGRLRYVHTLTHLLQANFQGGRGGRGGAGGQGAAERGQASQAAPNTQAQSGANYKVDTNWARLPAGTTWNGNTTWITADGKGQVVVLVRTAPYFRVLTRDGAFVKAFGEDGLFESAHSVTIDAQGILWVTDSAAHVVHKFSPDGRLLMTLGKKGVAGDNTSRDLFNQPNHVALAPNGDIYVSDGYVNARVVHFSGDGRFVRIIGGVKGSQPGQLQLPHGVALDSKGRILINDSDNQRVSVFAKDGTFVEAWPYPSRGGIAVAADDTVYISDVNAGIVNIVKNGKLIDSVAADRAHGMGIDTDGSIYVSGASRMTVMKIVMGR